MDAEGCWFALQASRLGALPSISTEVAPRPSCVVVRCPCSTMDVHLVGIEAGSVRFRTWAPAVVKAPASAVRVTTAICGYPHGEGPAFQAVHRSVRFRVSAPCRCSSKVEHRVANATAGFRLPTTTQTTRTQGANADCNPAGPASIAGRVSDCFYRENASARSSKPLRPGSTPGGSATSHSSSWPRNAAFHAANAGSNPACDTLGLGRRIRRQVYEASLRRFDSFSGRYCSRSWIECRASEA
jgi:hypothetical protein